MEEKKGIRKASEVEVAENKTISLKEANEQMQKIVTQANQKIQQLAMQLNETGMLLRDKTLDQLFQVLKYAHEFTPEFVTKCADAIETYLTNNALEPQKDEAEEAAEAESTKEDAE